MLPPLVDGVGLLCDELDSGLTTLLDHENYPAREIATLYAE